MSMLDIYGNDPYPSNGTLEEVEAWKKRHQNWIEDIMEYWGLLGQAEKPR